MKINGMRVTLQVRHDLDPNRPIGYTTCGELVDVGLPNGETAALCHVGPIGCVIRHVESGLPIGGFVPGSPADAINFLRAENLLRKGILKGLCENARFAMYKYRCNLWDAAMRAASLAEAEEKHGQTRTLLRGDASARHADTDRRGPAR